MMAPERSDPSPETLVAVAKEAARAGAAVLQRYFLSDDLDIREKARHDFVTRADHESEAAVVAAIHARFPDHAILAEEGGATAGSGGHEWLIDPLDGTTNFLQGLPVFAVSIACRRGEDMLAAAVLEPATGHLFWAARGQGAWWNERRMRVSDRQGPEGAFLATGYPWRSRAALDTYLDVFRDVFLGARSIRRCGAAALDLAYTAAGVYDGFFEFRLAPWDIAAGDLLVREAGGQVTDLDGGRAFYGSGNVVAGNPAVHAGLLSLIGAHVSEADLDRLVPQAEPSRAGDATTRSMIR